jgi:hypothetical protein
MGEHLSHILLPPLKPIFHVFTFCFFAPYIIFHSFSSYMLSLISHPLFCSSFNFLQFIFSLLNHSPLLLFSPFPIILYILLLRLLTFILFHSLLLFFFLKIFKIFYLFPFLSVSFYPSLPPPISSFLLSSLLLHLFIFSFLHSLAPLFSFLLLLPSSYFTSPLPFFASLFSSNALFLFHLLFSRFPLLFSPISSLQYSSFRSLPLAGGTVLRCLASALHSAATRSARDRAVQCVPFSR